MDAEARRLIDMLALERHPEGGFYREVFRSPLTLMGLPHGAPRQAHTAIYYLLPAGIFSPIHRIKSDEVWHHYEGDPVELHLLDEWEHNVVMLGHNWEKGERPQVCIPAGTWQAATVQGSKFALVGCTVAPGFEFDDLEIHSQANMLQRFPQHSEVIKRLTHI